MNGMTTLENLAIEVKATEIDIHSDGSILVKIHREGTSFDLVIPATVLKCDYCQQPGLKRCDVVLEDRKWCEDKIHCRSCSLDAENGLPCFLMSGRKTDKK